MNYKFDINIPLRPPHKMSDGKSSRKTTAKPIKGGNRK